MPRHVHNEENQLHCIASRRLAVAYTMRPPLSIRTDAICFGLADTWHLRRDRIACAVFVIHNAPL
jgi:hypothetical protein